MGGKLATGNPNTLRRLWIQVSLDYDLQEIDMEEAILTLIAAITPWWPLIVLGAVLLAGLATVSMRD